MRRKRAIKTMGNNTEDDSGGKPGYTEISGHGNRVAQRDYYELHQVHDLTLSQINQLDVVPCPVCEQRLIRSGMSSCNHCDAIAREEANRRRGALILIAAAVLLVAGYSITSAFGISEDLKHPVAILFAGLIFLGVAGLFFVARQWLYAPSLSKESAEARKLILAICIGLIGLFGVFLGQYLSDGIGGWLITGGVSLLLFTMILLR